MVAFQKGDICYPIYGMGGAISEAINLRSSNVTFASNESGFTVIETIKGKQKHTFYANNGKKKEVVFEIKFLVKTNPDL